MDGNGNGNGNPDKRVLVKKVSSGGDSKRHKPDDPVEKLLSMIATKQAVVVSRQDMDKAFEAVLHAPGLIQYQWRQLILFFIGNGIPASKLEQILLVYKTQMRVGVGQESVDFGDVIEKVWEFCKHKQNKVECDVLLVLVQQLPEELVAGIIHGDDKWLGADAIVDMCYQRTDINFYKCTEILDALDATKPRIPNQPLMSQLDWTFWIERMLNNNPITRLLMLYLATFFTKNSAFIGSRTAILRNFSMQSMFVILLPHLKQVHFRPKRRLGNDSQSSYPHNEVDKLYDIITQHETLPSLLVLELHIEIPRTCGGISSGSGALKKVLRHLPRLEQLQLSWFCHGGYHSQLNSSGAMEVLRSNVHAIHKSSLQHLNTIKVSVPIIETNEGTDDDNDDESELAGTRAICKLYEMEQLKTLHVTIPPAQVFLTPALKRLFQSNISLKHVTFWDQTIPDRSYLSYPNQSSLPRPKARPSRQEHAELAALYAKLNLCGRSFLFQEEASITDFLKVVNCLKVKCSTPEETLALLYIITKAHAVPFIESTIQN